MMSHVRSALPAAIVFTCTCALAGSGQQTDPLPSAEVVMARVAVNQDQAEAERSKYVYVQHARTVSRHGDKVMCEEITDYRMTPTGGGSQEELLNLDGRQLTNHQYLTYHALPPDPAKPPEPVNPRDEAPGKKPDHVAGQEKTEAVKTYNDKGDHPAETGEEKKDQDKKGEDNHEEIRVSIGADSIDRDIVENMRWNLIHDKSKDGISAHLFPLTSKDQADYAFRMAGRERMNGRDVYHITFVPKKKDDFAWRGDAYIDTAAYQPVLVTTVMARKIPFAVRTLLGTNVPGLGFTITYAPRPDGVWFPVTFSTEFKIHVLFFFNREIILDAQNREFEKTHVTSRIVGDATAVEPKDP